MPGMSMLFAFSAASPAAFVVEFAALEIASLVAWAAPDNCGGRVNPPAGFDVDVVGNGALLAAGDFVGSVGSEGIV